MVSQHWTVLILLVSLVLTTCVQSHDHMLGGSSPQLRVRRTLPSRTREKVAASSQVAKDLLALAKERLSTCSTESASKVVKSLAKIASLAPGIGGLVASFINVVLAFIPQENPLAELRSSFVEVNRKLDSLSIQISSLAADVEWFNYASVYSRDEVNILNAWIKFNDLRENSALVQSQEEKNRLAEIFVSFYENSGAESSVSNLYHYLTVSSTSLSENLNNLLMKKFKCDISIIGKYNLYFSSLLWKGMVLNQFYWKLIGFNTTTKAAEHVEMFKTVSEAQASAVEFCLNNYEKYMKEDVVIIIKGLSPDNKQLIADEVKKALDRKYSWYSWVVVVYTKDNKERHMLYNEVEIVVDSIIVTVSYVQRGYDTAPDYDTKRSIIEKCFIKQKSCDSLTHDECLRSEAIPSTAGVKVIHVSYDEDFVEVPAPFYQAKCTWSFTYVIYSWVTVLGKISFRFYNKEPVCTNNECQNGGTCKRLLDSNEWFCKCQDGYYGDTCENRLNMTTSETEPLFPPISTLGDKLKNLESKLEDLMKTFRPS